MFVLGTDSLENVMPVLVGVAMIAVVCVVLFWPALFLALVVALTGWLPLLLYCGKWTVMCTLSLLGESPASFWSAYMPPYEWWHIFPALYGFFIALAWVYELCKVESIEPQEEMVNV